MFSNISKILSKSPLKNTLNYCAIVFYLDGKFQEENVTGDQEFQCAEEDTEAGKRSSTRYY